MRMRPSACASARPLLPWAAEFLLLVSHSPYLFHSLARAFACVVSEREGRASITQIIIIITTTTIVVVIIRRWITPFRATDRSFFAHKSINQSRKAHTLDDTHRE